MTTVNIIFKEPHTAVRNSGGFVVGEEIKEVNFIVTSYIMTPAALELVFPESTAVYGYPWHTIARYKISE